VALPEGSRLLLVTDGVTDAHRPGGELLGTAGLLRLMMDRSKSPREVLDGALAMVAEHAGDGPADDIAMLFLEVCAAKARSDVRAVFDSHPKPCLLR
jgi:serine phosphatase RsbU (regulator of sigma subunit)